MYSIRPHPREETKGGKEMTKRELYYIGSLLKEVERSDDKIEALESLYFEIRTLHKCECKRRCLTQKEERK